MGLDKKLQSLGISIMHTTGRFDFDRDEYGSALNDRIDLGSGSQSPIEKLGTGG